MPPQVKLSLFLFSRVVPGMILAAVFFGSTVLGANVGDEQATRQFFQKYCLKCHGEQRDEGLPSLVTLDELKDDSTSRVHWQKIFQQIKSRAMPPLDSPQPTEAERDQAVKSLDQMLSWVDPKKGMDPGRVTVRRLNRQEYDNTVRDLFGISFKPGAQLFPDDNVGYGFDNIGDVLSVSPLRMQSYLEAAEMITDALFNDGSSLLMNRRTVATTFSREGKSKGNGEGIILWPNGISADDVEFPIAGEYELDVSLFGLLPENELKRRGQLDHDKWDPPKVEPEYDKEAPLTQARILCDDQVIQVVDAWHGGFWRQQTATMRFRTTAGRHSIRIQNDATKRYTPEDHDNWVKSPEDAPRLGLHVLQIRGPYGALPEQLTPQHRRLVTSVLSDADNLQQATVEALTPLMTAAFRRPVEHQEVEVIVGFMERQMADGRTYQQALKLATQTILISPHFLFRLELGPTPENPELIHPVSDYALASRLSYCLWKTLPDETLMNLASHDELHQEAVLRSQVARMLEDSRASEFVHSFFGQWLGLNKLSEIQLDGKLYPGLSTEIKNDLMTETMMLAEYLAKENRSVLEILNADYSFMNKRLARFYGINTDEWTSNGFRRVSLDGLPRRGVLTQAGVLMLTSYPNRTSPTKRGKWILETILNDEPPAAPPDVPTLESKGNAGANVSLRQQLEEHRRNPGCASCHQMMDSIGFGFENFDASGQWRDMDGQNSVDSAGKLPSGESFSGPVELIQILMNREDEFVRCVVEKLMTFSLGRGIEYFDRPAIDQVITNTKQSGYRFNDLVAEIIVSRPFLLQRGEGTEP